MQKLKLLNRIKEIYESGQNVIQYLKEVNQSNKNSIEDILISYDFQAGTYSRGAVKNIEFRKAYGKAVADIINSLGTFKSVLEAGVGEATTLSFVVPNIEPAPKKVFGFDISWSRIKYGNEFLKYRNITNAQLCTADLFHAPFMDSSIDVVYTSHSIEPNGGREEEAIKELLRITKKYLILLEPAYELASPEAQARMLQHGYVTNLYAAAQKLGCEILDYRLFPLTPNPLNPTGIMIIKKDQVNEKNASFACPITKTELELINNVYFSKESLLAYPVVVDIPCLLPQNAIIATHFLK
ncbi:MAG: methyltransferase domain-containing protein [Saprospiraceae bacterium]|jgi:ubiquinone/menaquinone biosynthesis C-methylase UbiE